jgi:hypothetical protein
MMLALILAQLMHTPAPFMTPTPVPVSERLVLQRDLDSANVGAQTRHDVLGAVVSDVTTGTDASVNADEPFPLGDGRALPIAILTFRAIDGGSIRADDSVRHLLAAMMTHNDANAADALLQRLGGIRAANASLRALGSTTLVFGAGGSMSATPSALAALIDASRNGSLLSSSSRTALLALLASFHASDLLFAVETHHLHTFVIVALHQAQGDAASARVVFHDVEDAVTKAATQF